MRKLYLASLSPRRRQLLKLYGLDYESVKVRVKERFLPGEIPEIACQRLALEKAIYGAVGIKEGVVLGCDTIVVVGGQILGKPRNPGESRMMLEKLSGREHSVFTGLALLDVERAEIITDFERTTVYFKELDEGEIDAYIKTGEPIGKAGGYAIQGKAAVFVQRIEGCFYNVVGLPLYRLGLLLKKIGIEVK